MVVKIHLYLLLMIAYMYALENLNLFLISYAFIILHETSHVMMANLLKVKVFEVEMLPIGMNAKYERNISIIKELLISLAGPIASLLFYQFFKSPLLKSINLFIALLNLIPLKPFDGGRIVSAVLQIIFDEEISKKITIYIQKNSLNLILILMIFSIIKLKNYYLAIACIYIICILKEELKNERFNEIIRYLQID